MRRFPLGSTLHYVTLPYLTVHTLVYYCIRMRMSRVDVLAPHLHLLRNGVPGGFPANRSDEHVRPAQVLTGVKHLEKKYYSLVYLALNYFVSCLGYEDEYL